MYMHTYLTYDLYITAAEEDRYSDSLLQNYLWCHFALVSKSRLTVTQEWDGSPED